MKWRAIIALALVLCLFAWTAPAIADPGEDADADTMGYPEGPYDPTNPDNPYYPPPATTSGDDGDDEPTGDGGDDFPWIDPGQ